MSHRGMLAACLIAALLGLLIYGTTCAGCSDGEKPPKRTPTPIDPAKTGSIKGAVLFKGTPPPEGAVIEGGGDAVCQQNPPARDERILVKINKEGRQIVQNAFVYVKSGLGDFVPSVPDTPVVVDQKTCIFRPRVVGVQRYQYLKVTNSDQTEHNVKFTETKGNPEHDKTMTGAGQSLEFWFPKDAVMMRVVCSKHSWMRLWVGVVDHPFFKVTGEDGTFELSGIPAGTYTLGCWTEAFGEQEQSVKVEAKGTATAEFSFSKKE